MATKLLSRTDIGQIVQRVGLDELYDELIVELSEAFKSSNLSSANIPPRTGIHYLKPNLGLIEWMPATIEEGVATLKLVGYHPSNPVMRNLPTILASTCLFDTNSGHLLGLLDGTFLTALRTGAMSAVATKLLAKDNAKTLGIIGCGAQAVTQAHALSRVIDIETIIAYDIDQSALSSFQDRISFLNVTVQTVTENQIGELLTQSDVLCTCTSEEPGIGPLFADFNNKPGLHINAVGSDFPKKIELPVKLLLRSFICPDFYAQAIVEGECQQLQPENISEDIATLLNQPELSKQNRQGLTVFDSTGHAFSDYVTSRLFFKYSNTFGLGTEIELECVPSDPKNPYSFFNDSIT